MSPKYSAPTFRHEVIGMVVSVAAGALLGVVIGLIAWVCDV